MNQNSPLDPTPHDHGEHHGGEDYPRLELNRLVSESQANSRMRRVWQTLLLSIGLILIALGLPTERFFGGLEVIWQMDGSGPAPQGLMALPILASQSLFGIGLEASAFLWSAILYGASLFLLMRLMHRIGFDHEVGLAATLVVAISPLAWLGGTLPIEFSAGLFGSTLLCTSLFQTQQSRKQGYMWRATSYLLLAFMLQPENIWLAPAAIWAVDSRGKGQAQARTNAFSLAVVTGLCLWVSVTVGGGQWPDLWSAILGNLSGSPSILAGIGFWLAALGCAWLGLFYLLLGRREAEEQPAPNWVLAWIAVGVAPIVVGGLEHGPRGAFLLPMAGIGVADWLTRRVHVEHRAHWSSAMVAVQILLTAACAWGLQQTNPDRAWSQAAQAHFTPDDLFLSDSVPRAYLARFRQGVSTGLSDELGTEIHSSKRKGSPSRGLVLDGWAATPEPTTIPSWIDSQLPSNAPERRPLKVLTKEGLIPAQQVP